jgi:transposase InsO family protein
VHEVRKLCRNLTVSAGGYYGWLSRKASCRAQKNEQLLVEIRQIHYEYRQAYGSLKVWEELKSRGINCGKNRVARLRQLHGIETKRRRRFKLTTKSKRSQEIAPNVVNRCFKTGEPDRVWCGDVTYIATRTGWLYLAVMIDLFSRKVIGWSMSDQNNKQLALNALDMAIAGRKTVGSVVHHTDRGALYACDEYVARLRSNNMIQSMSRKGDCYDNAVAESFFGTLKNELVLGKVFKSREEARSEIFSYIEVFYNRKRMHQSLGYKTPEMMEASVP